MPITSLLRRHQDMRHLPSPNCHGGQGVLDWTIVLEGSEHPQQRIRLHDDVLPPGASIGEHPAHKEEHYYILTGNGTALLDGRRLPITAGDVMVVFPGGSHGLMNDGTAPMRLLVAIACS